MSEGLDSTDQSPPIASTPNEHQPHIETDLRGALDANSGLEQESQVEVVSETPELRRLKGTLERRERQLTRLRYRFEVERWKLASMRQRRWWRIGTELGEVRRRPRSLLTLPMRLLRAVTTKSPPLARPTPPPELAEAMRESKSRDDAEAHFLGPIRPRHDVAALTVLSADLRAMVSHEVQTFELNPDQWRDQLATLAPHLLIVSSNAPDTPMGMLADMLDVAHKAGVRTVLWDDNPTVLSDDLRSRFEIIVADGNRTIENYAGLLVRRQGLVQPRIHNPIGARRRNDSTGTELSRRVLGDTTYATPGEIALASKDYKLLRTVTPAETAELAPIAASGTPVLLSGDSNGFGIPTDTDEQALALERSLLQSEVFRARLAHPQMRQALREFSISADINEILSGASPWWPQIDVMVATKRPEKLESLFANLGRQTYPNFRVTLVAHGFQVDEAETKDLAQHAGIQLETLINVPEEVILGEVFNIGFGETEAEIVAKVDDDDFYGAEYLWDLYSALDFSGAEVAGKWAHYAYLEGPDSTVFRYPKHEHRFTDVVAISTLLMHREVLEAERFPAMPWGSGSVFLRALGAQGARVFAADRWNYLYIRGQDGDRNTFPISDLKLLSISDIICRGINTDEVVV